ncbi:MAG: hypothetical protein E7012_01885 [Alphaproteobacteria bacterium]|nr:hypothetical protein [Alphaproteobacteria bacterium]
MENNNSFSSGKDTNGDTWYVDNYVLLKDYYDRTISRIAARCVRSGNIAIEEYPFYGYILDVLEEISETGEYILSHPNLHQYVERKIAGGIQNLKKTLNEFKTELKNNSSPEMIKQDKDELKKMKEALGMVDKAVDPTVGAGMSMDEVINKLMKKQDNQQNASKNQNKPNQQQNKSNPQSMQQQKNNQQAPRNMQSSPFNKGSN